MEPIFNFSFRRVGGLRFIRLGRFNLTFSISRGAPCDANF